MSAFCWKLLIIPTKYRYRYFNDILDNTPNHNDTKKFRSNNYGIQSTHPYN